MAVVLGETLAVWLIALAMLKGGHIEQHIVAIPFGGLMVCTLFHFFMIRCPRCGANLAYLTRSIIDFSLLHFPRRARFCPHCTFDFQDELEKKR